MKISNNLLALAILLIILSCGQSNRAPLMPKPTGAPGDVLLVVNEKIWKSFAGDTLRAMLAGPVEALPQNEPKFDVVQIEHRVFDKNFKLQRNIVVVKVGADQPESKVLFQKGLWAKDQLLISLHAKNLDSLIILLNEKREDIVGLIENTERSRLMKAYRGTQDMNMYNQLKENHNFTLSVPKGFKVSLDEKGMVWLTQEYRDIIQGILIYSYDYTDPETFTRDFLSEKRDFYTKKYIPGEIENSYVQIEPLFPPLFREYSLKDKKYTAELRGLWRMEGGLAMGGPFISITQLDEERNKVVTADAFVFAPGHKKRELLRQLEAIIFTLDFTDIETPENE